MNMRGKILYIGFAVFLLGINIFLYKVLTELNENIHVLDSVLDVLIAILATFSFIIFTIPFFFKDSEIEKIYPKSDQKFAVLYFMLFIITIFFCLLACFEGDTHRRGFLIISFLLFIDCLILLFPYIFIFLHRDMEGVIKNVRNSIVDELCTIHHFGKSKSFTSLNEKINLLGRIAIQALRNYNYILLDYTLENMRDVAQQVINKEEIHTKNCNSAIKEIMRNFRDFGIISVKYQVEEYSKRVGKDMSKIIIDGMKNERRFEYGHLIQYLEKFGIDATRNHAEETSEEIISNLGLIGDFLVKNNEEISPINGVLKGLQNIGISCSGEKMIHRCNTARMRLIGIARATKGSVKSEAQMRFWVVTAFLYTNIPEMKEADKSLEYKLITELGEDFYSDLEKSEEMLRKEKEWIHLSVVKKFRKNNPFFNKGP